MGSTTITESNFIDDFLTTEKREMTKDEVIDTVLNDDSILRSVEKLSSDNTFVKVLSSFEKNLNDPHEQMEYFEIPELVIDNFGDKKKSYSNTQRWVGQILNIEGDVIIAKLNDLNDPTTHEIADFEMKEVPFEDRALVAKGASFYWSLGYANDNGQIEKRSLIRFQRTKPWEEADINEIIDGTDKLYQKLEKWD